LVSIDLYNNVTNLNPSKCRGTTWDNLIYKDTLANKASLRSSPCIQWLHLDA
jgi:hypothetical protein